MLTIGKLAKQAGVGVETIRFYERKGILRRPGKPREGYRTYDSEASQKIYFVRRAQELGFTLREIKEILEMEVSSRATCADFTKKAAAKLEEIESKIRDLKKIRSSLQKFAKVCGSQNISIRDCGILECIRKDGCDETSCIDSCK